MDPISLIVTALSAGAVAALESTVGKAINDAYDGLKTLIQRKYPSVDLKQIEEKPESAGRKMVVQEELEEAKAADDTELQQQAQLLLDAIKAEPSSVTGVSLEEIEGASLKLADIIAQGAGGATGVELKNSKFTGDIDIRGVRASDQPLPSPEQSDPKA